MNNICITGIMPQEQADRLFVDWSDFKTRDSCGICNKYHWWPRSDLIWNAELKRYICKDHSVEEISKAIEIV